MKLLKFLSLILLSNLSLYSKPNIILVMTDDQGWGQTGYMNHPVLKTPNLDKMAESGLCLKRFYAGGPVCSPTRATVLTDVLMIVQVYSITEMHSDCRRKLFHRHY